MKTNTILAVFLTLLLTGTSFAQKIDRTVKPTAGPAPAAAFPDFQETRLANGLKVVVITNTSQPLVSFRLLIKSGAENDTKSGIASFTTDLMTKGTTTRNSLQFATEEDRLGLSINASAGDDAMYLTGSGLKKHMDKILDLMSDALLHPVFPEEELTKSKKQMISGLQTEEKDPSAMSSRLQLVTGFGSHPYAQFATKSSVEGITREDLVSFHKTYFIPNNASFAVVGDITLEEAVAAIKRYFGEWAQGPMPSRSYPAIKPIRGTSVHLVNLGATQTQSSIALVTSAPKRNDGDNVALRLANSILGGGFSGRLFQNLRETHAFTYGAYSSPDSRKMGGMWVASADVRRAATDSAITEIMKEMKRMVEEPVSEEDLTMHKQYISGQFLLSLESPGTTASRLQDIDLYGLPKDYYKTYVTRMMATSSADMQKVAKKYWDPQNIAITVVGDGETVKPLLEKFGEVKLYDTEMKPISADVELPIDIDGPTLIGKYITASGGAAFTAMKDQTMEGAVSLSVGPQTLEGTLTSVKKMPNLSYEKMAMKMGAQETWCDGTTVEQSSFGQAQSQKLEGDELASSLEENQLNDIARFQELGFTATVTAKKKGKDATLYTLELKKKHGTQTLLFDAETFLLYGENKVQKTPQGEVPISLRYKDYKPVSGILLPHTILQDLGQISITVTVKSYAINTNPKDEVFRRK